MITARRRELERWAKRATDGLANSAVMLSLFTESVEKDPIPVLQLGYALVLDKPIVIVAPEGRHIPWGIRRVARAIEFYDPADTTSLQAAALRALKAAGLEVKEGGRGQV